MAVAPTAMPTSNIKPNPVMPSPQQLHSSQAPAIAETIVQMPGEGDQSDEADHEVPPIVGHIVEQRALMIVQGHARPSGSRDRSLRSAI
jgi:hypothetical protein